MTSQRPPWVCSFKRLVIWTWRKWENISSMSKGTELSGLLWSLEGKEYLAQSRTMDGKIRVMMLRFSWNSITDNFAVVEWSMKALRQTFLRRSSGSQYLDLPFSIDSCHQYSPSFFQLIISYSFNSFMRWTEVRTMGSDSGSQYASRWQMRDTCGKVGRPPDVGSDVWRPHVQKGELQSVRTGAKLLRQSNSMFTDKFHI